MNYNNSRKILQEIKKAKKILLNLHRGPDQDSFASVFAMEKVLRNMGKKEIVIYCSTEPSYDFAHIGDFSKVTVVSNADAYDFGVYDLIIILDSAGWRQFGFVKKETKLNTNFVNIDHHPNSEIGAKVEIIDTSASATCEVLYLLFQDWGVAIDTDLGKTLLYGILGDTGVMRYSSTTSRTLQIAAEIYNSGVDYNMAVFQTTQIYPLQLVLFWQEIIKTMHFEERHRFIWSAVDYKTFKKYKFTASSTSEFSNLIGRAIKGTDFCIVMVEKKPKYLTLSVRSRYQEFNSSVISEELGGGGHTVASGAVVEGLDFNKAVEKVIQVAKKHARRN